MKKIFKCLSELIIYTFLRRDYDDHEHMRCNMVDLSYMAAAPYKSTSRNKYGFIIFRVIRDIATTIDLGTV